MLRILTGLLGLLFAFQVRADLAGDRFGPADLAATAQFADLCPTLATFMRNGLAADKSLQARRP